ncbi:MAG: outer membrane beta-barrel protein [Gammaproteobacteria bacterium]|nr:outer membrane beta-barrel protein [Gammaproteobacteria bacterium]MDH5650458.1 outer membrane beta-barrel protein [Gammaproteobacteria bacterium]
MQHVSLSKTLLVASALLISSAASAETYVGGALGQSGADLPGYQDADSMKIFGGTRYGNMGIEATYIDFGQFDINSNSHADVTGIELSAVAYMPITNNFDLMGKVGLLAWNADVTFSGSPVPSEDDVDLALGIGAQYKVTDNIAVRAEYQLFSDVNGSDVDMFSAGVSLHF